MTGVSPITALRIRAEMARHGLLSGQLGFYENPDTGHIVNPQTDPDTIAGAWRFLGWLERELSK